MQERLVLLLIKEQKGKDSTGWKSHFQLHFQLSPDLKPSMDPQYLQDSIPGSTVQHPALSRLLIAFAASWP